MTLTPTFTAGHLHVAALTQALERFAGHVEQIDEWGDELAARLLAGARLLTVGNGGSAAQAQHLSSEIVGRYSADRPPFSAVALHTEPSVLTAIVNDYGAQEMFARQVAAHGRAGDVLVAMSTSGTSANVIAAAGRARALGVSVWALTGPAPNPLADAADRVIAIDAAETSTVQELSLVALHMICAAFDERVLGPLASGSAASPPGPADSSDRSNGARGDAR